MPLRIRFAPDLAAAETLLDQRLNDLRLTPFDRVNILVGSSLQRLYQQRRLAQSHDGALAAAWFFTPVDLAQAAADLGATPARRPLPRGAETALLRQTLQQLAPDLSRLRPDTPGLASALLSALTDLREGGLAPAQLAEFSGRRDQPFLADLAHIYDAWTDAVRPWRDRTSRYEDALNPLTDDRAYRDALDGAPLIVTGIYDFTRVQRQLLRRCADVVNVEILLVAPDRDPSSLPRRAAAALTADPYDAERSEANAGASEAPPAPAAFSAADGTSEAAEIARRILDTARDGVPFHRIAVFHAQGAAGDQRISAALQRAGVPAYRAAGESVGRTASGRAAAQLLRLLWRGGDAPLLLDLLANPSLPPRLPIPSHSEAQIPRRPLQWERLARHAALTSDWRRLRAQLDLQIAFANDENDDPAGDIARDLRAIVADLSTRSDAAQAAQAWTDAVHILRNAIDTYTVANNTTQVLQTALDRLTALDDADLPYDDDAFLRAAERALESAVIRDADRLSRGVYVGAISGAGRFLRWDAVFAAGLAERVFPRAGRQNPLLRDDLRERINRRWPGALSLQHDRAASDRHAFALLRQASGGRLTLSWARRAAAVGAPSRASVLLLETLSARALSEEALVRRGRIAHLPPALSSAAPSRDQVDAGDWSPALRALDDADLHLALLSAPGLAPDQLLPRLWPPAARAAAAIRGRRQHHFAEYDGIVGPDAAPHANRPDRPFRIADIIRYTVCPYQFFLADQLGLPALSEPQNAAAAASRNRAQLLRRILQHDTAAQDLDAAETAGLLGPPATAHLEREHLLTDLARLRRADQIDARTGRQTIAANFHYDALPLPLSASVLQLSGRIERVDRSDDGRLIAVEYGDGNHLTAALQLFALSALQDAPLLNQRSSELRSLDPRSDDARVRFDGANDQHTAHIAETLHVFADGLTQGRFFPHPGDREREHCQACPFEAACTPDINLRARYKARRDPDSVQQFRRLRARRLDP